MIHVFYSMVLLMLHSFDIWEFVISEAHHITFLVLLCTCDFFKRKQFVENMAVVGKKLICFVANDMRMKKNDNLTENKWLWIIQHCAKRRLDIAIHLSLLSSGSRNVLYRNVEYTYFYGFVRWVFLWYLMQYFIHNVLSFRMICAFAIISTIKFLYFFILYY